MSYFPFGKNVSLENANHVFSEYLQPQTRLSAPFSWRGIFLAQKTSLRMSDDVAVGVASMEIPENIDLSISFGDFTAWIESAPTEVLERALEIAKEEVSSKAAWISRADYVIKKMDLEKALKERERLKEWKEGEEASILWEFSGQAIHWPCSITKKTNFLRVKVLDETGLVELQDCTTGEEYISPLRQLIQTKPREPAGEKASFIHSVTFETAGRRLTFSQTNEKEKLDVGETLEWELVFEKEEGELQLAVPGLPSFYTLQLENNSGPLKEVAGSRIEGVSLKARQPWHQAPEPLPLPDTGVLQEGSDLGKCDSSLSFRNCHEESKGISIFAKVCHVDDAEEQCPTALATVFCHPGRASPAAKLPSGVYHIRIAEGHKWEGEGGGELATFYGEKYLFGPAGVYLKESKATVLNPNTDLTFNYPAGTEGSLERISQTTF